MVTEYPLHPAQHPQHQNASTPNHNGDHLGKTRFFRGNLPQVPARSCLADSQTEAKDLLREADHDPRRPCHQLNRQHRADCRQAFSAGDRGPLQPGRNGRHEARHRIGRRHPAAAGRSERQEWQTGPAKEPCCQPVRFLCHRGRCGAMRCRIAAPKKIPPRGVEQSAPRPGKTPARMESGTVCGTPLHRSRLSMQACRRSSTPGRRCPPKRARPSWRS